MILTFVLVNRNAVMVAVKMNKTCFHMNKGRGYVVVYRPKKMRVYCEYDDYLRSDRTVVRYILPLCLLLRKMNKQ